MADIALDTSVQFIKGVGPARAAQFESLGVRTVGQLLEHLPFRYELRPKSKPIGHLTIDETATIVGAIRSVRSKGGFRKSSEVVDVEDGTGRCRARWFNSPYLRDKLTVGQIIRLTGKVSADDRQAIFINPAFSIIDHDQDPLADDQDDFVPVYPATASLPSKQIAKVIRSVLNGAAQQIEDFVPTSLREKRSLPPRRTAVMRCHLPVSQEDANIARTRLAYDEFLLMQLAVQLRRRAAQRATGAPRIVVTEKIEERIRARLPFTLTQAQDKAVAEITRDMAIDRPMRRLLQGDVGAGKTAVAVYAALAAIANRQQVAMLAPTEVLAEQTFAKFSQYLTGSRVRSELLTGGMAKAKRQQMLTDLAAGKINLIVGTHALIEKDVRFASLGLVIIDEQHRFGVAQRQALRSKGQSPHYLVMTATPIPRTLAMTVFGHLDVTSIRQLPPGRLPVTTRLIRSDRSEEAWSFLKQRLQAGEQGYIVYPLVEESESLDLKAATAEFENLRDGELKDFNVGLLHGRMTGQEKTRTIEAFRAGQLHALVSTTVIEVGVDVPKATVMIIEHAERFGLSQLHQLRGRIGRSSLASYCLLMSDALGRKSFERLGVLCSTTDGFKIAEADLQMRGPGELVGTRQHGLPEFKAADLVRDFELLEQARDDAVELTHADPELRKPENAQIRREVLTRYPKQGSTRPANNNQRVMQRTKTGNVSP